jgi:hypothetical protein|tara:strand:- start:280 stop:444 length:165 start_codon:yes stop_codon:yes gene_type:complete
MKKVEVKLNGIVIGYTYGESQIIQFLDNDEVKKLLGEMKSRVDKGIMRRKKHRK